MIVDFYDIIPQHESIRTELRKAVEEVFDSCSFILGPKVSELEKEVGSYNGSLHALAVNSGTDALLLALAAINLQPGDEVITSPFTFVATAETICQLGGVPVFADIDPKTFNMDAAKIEEKITPKTKAILPVYLFGQLADMTTINAIAKKHNLAVIGDGAQAIGSIQNDKPMGSLADITTLSFYPTKNLGGCGDGGMVLTNSDEYCEELRLLRFHGSGGGYIYKRIGYCSRLDELQAAALLVKMKRIREWTETRRKNARFYFEALKNVSSVVLPTVAPGNQHVFHQFTLRVPGEGRRDALQEYLKVHDVGCAVFYPLSLHLQGPYAKFGYHTGDFPHSERVTEEVLSIPIHPHLGLEQLKYVAETIAAFK